MSNLLIAGEVLFDVFEDGSQVMGGAPFNVAWHLQGLGFKPLFVSRIGQDKLGEHILNSMQQWDMDVSGLQIDDVHETGTVRVNIIDGQPSYDIVKPVAYDFIEAVDPEQVADKCRIFYHGSLALRASESRQNILRLREELSKPVFVDINLRSPYWAQETIEPLLHNVNWLKLNHEELELLSATEHADLTATAQAFREQYSLAGLLVTEGEKGAFLVTPDRLEKCASYPVSHFVDSVGAGDGFTAMFMAGLLQNWDYRETLENASMFAARICELRGAISEERSFYDSILDEIH